jgi:hypothetical protein
MLDLPTVFRLNLSIQSLKIDNESLSNHIKLFWTEHKRFSWIFNAKIKAFRLSLEVLEMNGILLAN